MHSFWNNLCRFLLKTEIFQNAKLQAGVSPNSSAVLEDFRRGKKATNSQCIVLQKGHRAWLPSGTSQNSQNMQSLTVKSLVQVSSADWFLFCLSWTSSPIAMEQWCIFLGSGTYHLGDDCSQLCWCQSLDGVHANPSQADGAEMCRVVGLCICTGTHFHSGITVIIVSSCEELSGLFSPILLSALC